MASHDACPQCGFDSSVGNRDAAIEKSRRPARIEQLLHSNDAPKQPELAQMRTSINDHTARLSTLDSHIIQLQDALKRLQVEREWISTEITDLKAISHPMRRLSDDIVSEIFLACIEEDLVSKSGIVDSLDVRGMPWVLTRVCSRWRAIALFFPRLWATISVSLNMKRRHDATVIGFLLGLHLQRSGSNALRIWIQSDSPDTKNHHLLRALLPSSFRWHCAVFVLPWVSFKALLPIQGLLPRLHTLLVQISTCEDQTPEILEVFRYAPQLRNFSVINLESVARWVPAPWPQIVDYMWEENHACGDPHHLEVLRQTPDLEKCELNITNHMVHTPGPPITLHKLKNLGIDIMDPQAGIRPFSQHINLLTLPVLHSLVIDARDTLDADCVVSLLARSRCDLTDLALNIPQLNPNQLLQILEVAPALIDLIVRSEDCFSDNVVTRLIQRSGQSSCLVPSLKQLCLGKLTCTPELLFAMIESRLQPTPARPGFDPVASLELLEIEQPVDFGPLFGSRLIKWRAGGLEFVNDG